MSDKKPKPSFEGKFGETDFTPTPKPEPKKEPETAPTTDTKDHKK